VSKVFENGMRTYRFFTNGRFFSFELQYNFMDERKKKKTVTERDAISERELKPDNCMYCGSEKITIATHVFHDIQDMGSPNVKRVKRHEQVRWRCADCGEEFRVMEPSIPRRATYTDEVIIYATSRVLDKGDSARRVASDLKDFHNVEVDHSTISKWVKEREKSAVKDGMVVLDSDEKFQVDHIACDGTFKAVSSKKNDPVWSKSELSSLHVTRLRNGKLVAILPLGKTRKR